MHYQANREEDRGRKHMFGLSRSPPECKSIYLVFLWISYEMWDSSFAILPVERWDYLSSGAQGLHGMM